MGLPACNEPSFQIHRGRDIRGCKCVDGSLSRCCWRTDYRYVPTCVKKTTGTVSPEIGLFGSLLELEIVDPGSYRRRNLIEEVKEWSSRTAPHVSDSSLLSHHTFAFFCHALFICCSIYVSIIHHDEDAASMSVVASYHSSSNTERCGFCAVSTDFKEYSIGVTSCAFPQGQQL
jgi:hypothetical protein